MFGLGASYLSASIGVVCSMFYIVGTEYIYVHESQPTAVMLTSTAVGSDPFTHVAYPPNALFNVILNYDVP